MRRAAKRDYAEAPLVRDLRALGYQVYQMDLPCDLLVRDPRTDKISLLEVGRERKSCKRNQSQLDFIRDWKVPIVKTLDEAARALGTRML